MRPAIAVVLLAACSAPAPVGSATWEVTCFGDPALEDPRAPCPPDLEVSAAPVVDCEAGALFLRAESGASFVELDGSSVRADEWAGECETIDAVAVGDRVTVSNFACLVTLGALVGRVQGRAEATGCR